MTSLIEAQKFASRTLTEDGLIDVFAGIGFIVVGYFWLIDNAALSAIMPFALINLWKAARNRVVFPRIGQVTLHKEKKAHILTGRIILAIITLTLVVGVILWWMGGAGEILGTGYFPLFASAPSLFVAVITFFAAIYLKAPRFYGYAGWLLAAAGIAIGFQQGPETAFMLGGIPWVFIGVFLFARFLKTHPRED